MNGFVDIPNSHVLVHVIDGDAGTRSSLRGLMETADLPSKGYESAEEFLESVGTAPPGCIVLDLHGRGMGGTGLLQRLREIRNDMPVIMLSAQPDVPRAVQAMKLGAADVLQKPLDPPVLVNAVRRALESAAERHRRVGEEEAIRKRLATLTPRELELLRLVVAGFSNKEIASRLGISIKTVVNHRASLMSKTQALNAANLARLSTIAGIAPAG